MKQIQTFKGKLGESSDNLAKMLKIQEDLMKKAYKVYQFVSFQSTVDQRNMELMAGWRNLKIKMGKCLDKLLMVVKNKWII